MKPQLFVVLVALWACARDPAQVQIFQTHSLRGNIHPVEAEGMKTGGVSLLSGALKKLSDPQTLSIHLGVYNLYFGTPKAYFTEGKAVIDLMNRIGMDALLVGVRELYFGPEVFQSLAEDAQFPFVSTNLRTKDGGELSYLKTYWVSPGGQWVILNLTPDTFFSQNLAAHVKNFTLIPNTTALDEVKNRLPLPLPKSLVYYGSGQYDPNLPVSPALQEIIDHPLGQVVVCAPSPGAPEGVFVLRNSRGTTSTVVTQSGSRLMNGQILEQLVWDGESPPSTQSYLLNDKNFSPDPVLGSPLAELRQNLDLLMDETIASVNDPMTASFDKESTVGNFLTDLFRAYLKTEIFLLNSGTIRADLSPGPLSRRQVYTLLPFGGNLVKTKISGKDLLAVLNRSLTFAGRPEKGRGYLQLSGLSLLKNQGENLTARDVLVNGTPLNLENIYSLGTTSFLFGGGDTYSELQALPRVTGQEDPVSLLTIAMTEIKKLRILKSPGLGRTKL